MHEFCRPCGIMAPKRKVEDNLWTAFFRRYVMEKKSKYDLPREFAKLAKAAARAWHKEKAANPKKYAGKFISGEPVKL